MELVRNQEFLSAALFCLWCLCSYLSREPCTASHILLFSKCPLYRQANGGPKYFGPTPMLGSGCPGNSWASCHPSQDSFNSPLPAPSGSSKTSGWAHREQFPRTPVLHLLQGLKPLEGQTGQSLLPPAISTLQLLPGCFKHPHTAT